MGETTPVIVGTAGQTAFMYGGYDAISLLCRCSGQRYIKHNGNLYVSGHVKATGNLRHRPTVFKSTDNGLTWAIMDYAGSPDPFIPASETFPDLLLPFVGNHIVVANGAKFRFVQERGYLELTFAVGPTNDYEIKIYTFDCETELWSAAVIDGPATSETTITGGAKLLLSAEMRGSNELMVLYKATPASNEATSMLDIYNFETGSWLVDEFDVSAPIHIMGTDVVATETLAQLMVWDGTYTHFFTAPFVSGLKNLYHCTMSPDNTLNAGQDLLTFLLPAWFPADIIYATHNMNSAPVVWDGRVWHVSLSDLNEYGGAYDHELEIILWSAPFGIATPTWTPEMVQTCLVASGHKIYGPRLFVSNGKLRCTYKQTSSELDNTDLVMYTDRVNGVWTEGQIYYTYQTNTPPTGTWTASFYDNWINVATAIPDMPNELGFSVLADIWLYLTLEEWEISYIAFLSRSGCPAAGSVTNRMY